MVKRVENLLQNLKIVKIWFISSRIKICNLDQIFFQIRIFIKEIICVDKPV